MTHRFVRALVVGAATLCIMSRVAGYTAITSNDPWPLYTTQYPYRYLNHWHKEYLKGNNPEHQSERFSFSLTGFGQRATRGTDCNDKDLPFLHDVFGKWNMLALLFADACCDTLPEPLKTMKAEKRYVGCDDDLDACPPEPLTGSLWSDKAAFFQEIALENIGNNFGKVSVGTKYHKYGVRFQAQARLFSDLVLIGEGGVASISYTPTIYQDLSETGFTCGDVDVCDPENITPTQKRNIEEVRRCLTNEKRIKEIADSLGYKTDKFLETSFEDVRVHAVLRHSFDMAHDSAEWSDFIFTPFASIYGIFATSKEQEFTHLFSLPHGNNNHHGLGFNAGFSLDFHETIEGTIAYGATFFKSETYCDVPMPDDECQSGIFPCKADICVDPGRNWHFAGTISVYDFIDKLSFFLQYAIISHAEDTVTVCPTTPNADKFKPSVRTPFTKWNARMINAGFNYDLCPHIAIGFLVQIPTDRRTAFRTTSYLGSITGTY